MTDQSSAHFVRDVHEAAIAGGTLLHNVPDPPEDDPLREEWLTFRREASRLIEEGHKGRFALIKGNQIVSLWDTLSDAAQAGRERFGIETYMVQEVQPFIRPLRWGYARVWQD